MSSYRNRIVGLEYVSSADLTPHPGNWRDHPNAQVEAMRGVLAEVGIADALLAYRSEQNGGKLTVIDGHLRKDVAPQVWPVLVLDVTDAEADYILATHDPLAAMAQADAAALDALLDSINSGEAAVQAMLAELANDAGLYALPEMDGEEESDPEGEEGDDDLGLPELSARDVPDALFPTDNDWEIPTLDLRYQAKFVELPWTRWGGISRKSEMRGTYHFYTDDYKFTVLWADPTPVINSRCVAAVEPNFSTGEQMPLAVGLYAIYRKRWLARYWQQYGINIWVDLNVAPKMRQINLLGVPRGWRAYCTRGLESLGLHALEEDYAVALDHSDGDPIFVVYGGGQGTKELCKERGWIWIPEDAQVKRGREIDGAIS